jgi:hypothetical protein
MAAPINAIVCAATSEMRISDPTDRRNVAIKDATDAILVTHPAAQTGRVRTLSRPK